MLFEDANFSSDVKVVLASVVFPDCRSVLSAFNREAMLDALDVESVDEAFVAVEESSGGGGP